MGKLCLVACAKNEGRYLREWLDWYKLIGFEHVYLYDTGSDTTESICKEYGGFVTYTKWTTYPMQYETYTNFRDIHGKDWKWAAFFDLDEYLVPINYRLSNLLANFDRPDISGVAVGWHMMGHNGHLTHKHSTLDAYTKSQDGSVHRERFTKLIMRPMRIKSINDPHFFESIDGTRIVREDFVTLKWGDHHWRHDTNFPVQSLRLNHYFTRSLEDFVWKMERDWPDGKTKRTVHDFISTNLFANAQDDDLILKIREGLLNGTI